jgi:hypothetical protein
MKTKIYLSETGFICGLLLSSLVTINSSAQSLYPDLFSWAKPGTYMYDVQIDRTQGKLLRFSVAIGNKGAGPFELHGVVQSDGTTTATQWIYDSNGGHIERYAGTFVFSDHAGHNHFHFANFANYRLRAVTGKNGIGAVVAKSDKVGFAMFDNAVYNRSLPGAPSSPVYLRQEQSSLDPEGISVGWADVYARTLGDQWIDIAGVPNGQYWIEVTVDPNDLLAESDESNNTTYVKVILKGNHVKTNNDKPSPSALLAAASRVEQPVETVAVQSPDKEAEMITTYPNPNRGEFDARVEDSSTGQYQFRLIDSYGKPVDEQIITKDESVATAHFNLIQAKPGIYYLSIYHNGETTSRRILVSH